MQTYIILLRAVTPTGKNKVPMVPLRAALEQAGLQQVRTYIQSGNVIATTDASQAELEQLVHHVIAREFGGDIAVLARSTDQFRTILAHNPFPSADPAKLYFTLLASTPAEALVNPFLATDYSPDQVRLIGDVVYVCCATQYSDIRPNNGFIERKLKVVATTRVYNTMARLMELSAAS
ncbi:MAG: DUF1697 domain-containing protein [Chloroflexaceae bacterium]|jgi:uncharacterized protein (DUF1697 family)|nr:DUF1697 domain-containing protein [Chloroflexaceae bacterium]